MRYFLNILFALPFLLIVVNTTGCGDGLLKTEPVSGVITLDGVPLDDAMVNFVPKTPGQGADGFGRTNEKGEYVIQTMGGRPDAGTLPGEYAVTVTKYRLVPTGGTEIDRETRQEIPEMTSVLIFPRMSVYGNAATTPFSATVVKGRNRFDFDVKTQP